jgi:hypothetical protein
VGNVEDVISMAICDSGKSLVDFTGDNGGVRPKNAMKDEPTGPRGKQTIILL